MFDCVFASVPHVCLSAGLGTKADPPTLHLLLSSVFCFIKDTRKIRKKVTHDAELVTLTAYMCKLFSVMLSFLYLQ